MTLWFIIFIWNSLATGCTEKHRLWAIKPAQQMISFVWIRWNEFVAKPMLSCELCSSHLFKSNYLRNWTRLLTTSYRYRIEIYERKSRQLFKNICIFIFSANKSRQKNDFEARTHSRIHLYTCIYSIISIINIHKLLRIFLDS